MLTEQWDEQFIVLEKGQPMSIHICGNTTKILSDIADCGFSTFSLDNLVDLAEVKDQALAISEEKTSYVWDKPNYE